MSNFPCTRSRSTAALARVTSDAGKILFSGPSSKIPFLIAVAKYTRDGGDNSLASGIPASAESASLGLRSCSLFSAANTRVIVNMASAFEIA